MGFIDQKLNPKPDLHHADKRQIKRLDYGRSAPYAAKYCTSCIGNTYPTKEHIAY